MKRYESSEAICPYYRGERKLQIYCEGFFGNTLCQNFADGEAKEQFEALFCDCWQWDTCPIAQMHDRETVDTPPVLLKPTKTV